MIYIRSLLLNIRKANATLNEKQKILLTLAWLATIAIGVGIDTFIPFNYFTNVLRAAIALAIGVYSFALIYLLMLRANERRSNSERAAYVPIKERVTYKQRLNISIVLWGVLLVFALLGSKENSAFTSFSSILITSSLGILSFVRSTRDETQNAKIGFEDPRDVLFEKLKKEELERRKNELNESKKTSE